MNEKVDLNSVCVHSRTRLDLLHLVSSLLQRTNLKMRGAYACLRSQMKKIAPRLESECP